ncbi:MAG TPA: LacI family DNA-binding transcriptional regulator, partial [Acidimicrobiales bacterium]
SPNRAARSLAAHRSETVSLVVSEPSVRLFADPFFAGTTLGIAGVLGPTRYQLVLLMTQSDADRQRIERHLLRGGADGVLLVSTRTDDPLPGRLAEAGIPCVLAGRPPAGAAVGFVDADNVGGARRAVTHLVDRGRRVVATVSGPADMAPGADRHTGWAMALAAAGRRVDPSLVAEGDFTRAGGEAATRALLAARPDLDAVFVASDLMALGALDALRAAGRHVPDDVAVVGFDDSELARSADPPLTTVRQPIEQLGHEMARLLLARLDEGAGPSGLVLRTELVVRRSG